MRKDKMLSEVIITINFSLKRRHEFETKSKVIKIIFKYFLFTFQNMKFGKPAPPLVLVGNFAENWRECE